MNLRSAVLTQYGNKSKAYKLEYLGKLESQCLSLSLPAQGQEVAFKLEQHLQATATHPSSLRPRKGDTGHTFDSRVTKVTLVSHKRRNVTQRMSRECDDLVSHHHHLCHLADEPGFVCFSLLFGSKGKVC